MTTLPGSGQLSLLQVRDHLGGTGEVALPDDLYRGQLVPDVQQFTGNGFRSNDTGARFQVLRLFMYDGFMSPTNPGPTYTINFDTAGTTFTNPVNVQIGVFADVADAIEQIETAITDEYPAFEFSQVSHHTAQASSVEINCTNAATVSSGESTIYLHGNFTDDGVGRIQLDIPASTGGVELATMIETALNTNLRSSIFSADRSGAELTIRSTGRVNFWISDSTDGETFSFPTSIWAIRPAVRELTPEFGSRRETGNPPIDIGSSAGLSVLINTVQNGNPTHSVRWNANDGIDYWIDLTTETTGNNASATDEIIRIAIEDDFNAGAAIGEYPDHIPDCIELAGFNSVTHSVGDNFSFSTGGSIRSQSNSNTWSLTQGGGSGTSDAVELELTNDSGSVVDFTNGRVDVSITVTSLPTDGETRPILHVQSSGSLFLDISTATDPIDQLGEYIFSDVTADMDEDMIQPDGSLRIYFQEDDATRQGFEYTVNYVRLSTTQAEYKPAGIYPDISDSIAAVQFTQETFPTGASDSFAADGQLDGPIGGWRFHPITSSNPTILFEREFGGDVDFTNGRIDVSLDIISLPPGFNFITDRITIGMDVVNASGSSSSLFWNHEISGINITGEHFLSATTIEDGSDPIIPVGNELSIYFYIDDAAHRGLVYNVNYVRISTTSEAYTPTGGPASYTLNVDVGNIVFDRTIEDNFVAGSTATEALQHIGNSARDQYAQITVDTVTDGFVTNAIADRGFTGLQRESLTSFRIPDSWDLRQGSTPGSPTVPAFDNWADFVNDWFWFTGDYEPEGTSGTITITDSDQVTNRANFDWSGINRFTRTSVDGVTFPVTAIFIRADNVPSSGAPLAGATFSLALTDDGIQVPAKQIELHTNQTNDLMQTFGITPNTAINTISQISEFAVGGNVSGTNSSYTITDPSGSTMSLTAYSRENLASVSSRIRVAVNDMMDTPVDFSAVVLDNEILLKPTDGGLVDNDWTLLVNHGSGNDGSIGYTHSRPNSNVPTSGELTLPTTFYNVENGEVE